MAKNILKSCKSVFAYVKNRSFPSHIRSSFPWRPPLAEILDPRLGVGTSPKVRGPAKLPSHLEQKQTLYETFLSRFVPSPSR